MVTSIKFFESGYGATPEKQRVYKSDFISAETRYICWELTLWYQSPGRRTDFDIEAVWLRADGSEVTRQKNKSYIEAMWTSSSVSFGWGNQTPGAGWPAGSYSVEFYVDGKKVGASNFRVI